MTPPRHHLAKVVQRLQHLGLLETVRGRSGGVRLAATARTASIGGLVRKLEGETEVVDCEGEPACPLRLDMTGYGSRLTSFTAFVWYEQASNVPGAYQGFVDTDVIPLHPDADVYLCGPVPFMQAVRAGLHRRGMSDDQIRYEVFGSEQWHASPMPATR